MEEFITLIKDTIKNNVTLTNGLIIGKIGTGESNSMQIAPSNTETTFLNKSIIYKLDLLFLSKSKDQKTCINELDAIGKYLRRLKKYPGTDNICWSNAIQTSGPRYVDQEDGGYWIYSMVISNEIVM